MNIFYLMMIGASLAALTTSCSSRHEESTAHAPVLPEFSPKSGLFLPDTTRQSLGLEIVDVNERDLTMGLPLQLCVYRTNAAGVLASASITPQQVESLRIGQALSAHMGTGVAVSATITRVETQFLHSAGSAEVLVSIPTTTEPAVVGSFVHATAPLSTVKSALSVPRSAVLESSEGTFVYAVSGDHFIRTRVTTGAYDDDWVEITDGLYLGDQVASKPVMALWMTELSVIKGGQACCPEPPKGK